MAQSLERYGQVSPIVICLHEDDYVLIDGFKRLTRGPNAERHDQPAGAAHGRG